MRAKSGGGLTSNKLRELRAPKIEPRSKAISPGSADLIGQTVAYKKPPLVSGPGLAGPVGPTNNLVNGPKGQGRTLYGQGGLQGLHGKPNPGIPERQSTTFEHFFPGIKDKPMGSGK